MQGGNTIMARPTTNIDLDRVAHGAVPSVLTELTEAIIGFTRSPNFAFHCAVLAAFLCLGLGSAFLSWGISQNLKILVWVGLSWFMLSFAIWGVIGAVALWMLGKLVIFLAHAMRRQRS